MNTRPELTDDSFAPSAETRAWSTPSESAASKFPRLIKFSVVLGAFLAVVLIATFAIPPLLPSSWTIAFAERQIGAIVGLPVKISGDHSIRLLPSVRLTAEGIEHAAGADETPNLSIGRLELDLGALGLISGSADIRRVALRDPELRVVLRGNTEKTGGAGVDLDRAWGWWRDLSVRNVDFENGTLNIDTTDGDQVFAFTGIDIASAAPQGTDDPNGLAFNGRAKLNGEEIKVHLTTSDPALFVQGNRWPLKATLSSALMTGRFNGAMAMRQRILGEGEITLNSADASGLAEWLGLILPASPGSALTFKTSVKMSGDVISFERASVEIGDTRATAELTVRGLERRRLTVEGRVDASFLDFENADGSRFFAVADRSLAASILPPGRIDLNWQEGRWRGQDLGAGKAALIRAENTPSLSVEIEDVAMLGGTARGRLTLDASEGMRALNADLTLVEVEIGPLTAIADPAGPPPLSGQATVTINLFSVGGDAGQLRGALVGNAELIVKNGALSIPALTSELTETASQDIAFQSVNARFEIAQGIATTDDLLLRAEDISLVGSGRIDLTDGIIDLNIGRLTGDGGARALQRYRVTGPSEAISVEAIN